MGNDDTITITLDDTYGTTSTYMVDTVLGDGTFTIDTSASIDTDSIVFSDWTVQDNRIDPNRVEQMCEHYPALKKAWENFEAIYKMVDQDYKGNYEVDDDIPF